MNIKKVVILGLMAIAMAMTSVAASTVTDVKAKQRYPWNGLVDLKFTITGTSGEKCGVVFTAKDMVGGTNITMKTIRKSDGTIATTTEKLLPGSYNWIWNAGADLLDGFKCERMIVTIECKENETTHDKVQLWEGGPYWATTNIGAVDPWDSGYYFWWGDTVGYERKNDKWVASDGSSSNFEFGEVNTPTWDKTIETLLSEGWIISKDGTYVLAPEHDAAQVQWGGGWRMPTLQELIDLKNNCVWTETTMSGVIGYVVSGKGDYASNSIFLPCAGFGNGTSRANSGLDGIYWSSVPYSNSSDRASVLNINSQSNIRQTYNFYRYYGYSVRPVQGFTK